MTRCHICQARCEYEVEPAFGELPAVTERDVWTVAMGNGLYVDACHECWFRWPDDHKRFPPVGFGRDGRLRVHVIYDDQGELVEYELLPPSGDELKPSPISIEELVELLGPA